MVFIGAGYVGLVTSAVFADFGHKVWVIEVDNQKVEKLKNGQVPFYEPGLEKLILKNVRKGNLCFTTSYSLATTEAEIIFVCVGTPNHDGEIDLTYLFQSTKSLAEHLKKPAVVVIKSTVPPGINSEIEKWMKKYTQVEFNLASVPEFLREGKALEDTLHPDRVIIGSTTKKVADKLLTLHQKIGGQRLICDPTSAQIIKYASNAYLPTKISFANSVAVICDKFGANVSKVMEGVGMDRRIGPEFLGAGLGYGGSCFPKDIAALIQLAKRADYNFKILKAVQATNQVQLDFFIKKVTAACGGSLRNKKIAVLGLAFKPETSDVREARSIYVIRRLKRQGAKVRACDPVAVAEVKKMIRNVDFFTDPYETLRGADALLLVTEWKEFQKLDFKKAKRLMRSPVVVDGRNIYNRKRLEQLGFTYEGIGQ